MSEVGEYVPGESRIEATKQEVRVPEGNFILNRFNTLLYRFGQSVTRKSLIPTEGQAIERPISLRNRRAELFKAIKSTNDSAERRQILDEAHVRDEIARQYLDQGEVQINVEGTGIQTAKYTVVEPPNMSEGQDEKPPIFLIPGISNSLDGVASIIQELPFLGRKVVAFSYPESHRGTVTKEFAERVRTDQNFEAHSEFFKKAIQLFNPDGNPIDIWGLSTGAAIGAEILQDSEFAQHVKDVVFLSPAALVDQSKKQMAFGVAKDMLKIFSRFRSTLPRYAYSIGEKDKTPEQVEQRRLKLEVYNAIVEKVGKNLNLVQNAHVPEGGKITIVSGEKDDVTKSYKVHEEFKANPQVKLISLKKGTHSTPIFDATTLLPQILNS